ncbi:MAG TPA: PQQ-binding-like beta-propeller repeat protein, partial [Phycisphaerae bacterium]|nr:PQQ-binding-like beta-propeller repeat protein [Phycisphaerae bacterium]
VLGNGRLISLWPARGGPVLIDGKVCFAAGLLSFEGVYIHAVDARTGRAAWSNTTSGTIADALEDHTLHRGPKGVAGVSPQGYLSVVGNRLAVPSGRGLPAFADPQTGRLDKYLSGWGGREVLAKGSWYVATAGNHWFHSGDLYVQASRERIQIDPANWKGLGPFRHPVLTDEVIYCSRASLAGAGGPRPVHKGYTDIVAWGTEVEKVDVRKTKDGRRQYKHATLPELWRLPSTLKVHIKAGPRLYAGGPGTVAAVEIPKDGEPPRIAWESEIQGTPSTMLAADGKLVVVTLEGKLYCFGPRQVTPKRYTWSGKETQSEDMAKGYALIWGIGTGRQTEKMARQPGHRLIVVDPDADKVDAFRRRLDAAGLYGTRVSVHAGDPVSFPFPPYLASLIVSEDLDAAGFTKGEAFVARVYRALRPYGGVADLPVPSEKHKTFSASVKAADLLGATVTATGNRIELKRAGPLPGAADWTHPQADAANSFVCADTHVRGPLALLWFGGSMDLLFPDWDYTHSCHPIALVVGGRMFIQVRQTLSAADVYTGRLLWQVTLPRLEQGFYPYAAAQDAVYVACGATLVRIDTATGETLARFRPPEGCGERWESFRLWGDSLFSRFGNRFAAIDRRSGSLRWSHEAAGRLAGSAIGGGKVFLIDSPPATRGPKPKQNARILALDTADGRVVWEAPAAAKAGPIAGPTVAYCAAKEMVVLAHKGGIAAYNANDGTPLWQRDVPVPKGKPPRAGGYVLHQTAFVDTWTGKGFDPLTGLDVDHMAWQSKRGCSFAVASEHMMTLRDGHASFFELPSGRQTYLHGFRGGCTPSLIPANGLLNAPNYARGCTCNYAVYTSMGLVPVSDLP